mgnify:CR=1 FL=1
MSNGTVQQNWHSATDVVFQILTNSPETREDDRILIQHTMTWYLRDNGHNPLLMSAAKFLRLYTSQTKWPSFGTILRIRRKWQAQNPDLQGDNYIARKNHQHRVIGFLKCKLKID